MSEDFFAEDGPEVPIRAPSEEHSVFPALAEVHRRGGRPDEAEQVALRGLDFEPDRPEARVVLALALIDQGRVDEAHAVLLPIADRLLADSGVEAPIPRPEAFPELEPEPEPEIGESFTDDEIDLAFDEAEAERDQIIDADAVAQQAMRQVDEGFAEELVSGARSPFATRTMAELLERQGDVERAGRIRAALGAGAGSGDRPRGREERQRVIDELERWLDNLRGDRA